MANESLCSLKEDVVQSKSTVSDYIGFELLDREFRVAFIEAATGSGKTFFYLYKFATRMIETRKRILVPRKILKKQIEREILKVATEVEMGFSKFLSGISVMTYQSLEQKVGSGKEMDTFDAIICDEAHYFLDDAVFNANTIFALEYIQEYIQNRKGRVLMISATLGEIRQYFIKNLALRPVVISNNEEGWQ